MGVHKAHSEACEPRKGSVHSALPQNRAVDVVLGVGGDGPDHVGGIDVDRVHPLHTPCMLLQNKGNRKQLPD